MLTLFKWCIHAALGGDELMFWGLNKMTTILLITFSNAYLSMKMYQVWLKFHKNVLTRVQLKDDKSTMVQVTASKQLTSHNLNEYYFGVYFPNCCGVAQQLRKWTPKYPSQEQINSSPLEFINNSILTMTYDTIWRHQGQRINEFQELLLETCQTSHNSPVHEYNGVSPVQSSFPSILIIDNS